VAISCAPRQTSTKILQALSAFAEHAARTEQTLRYGNVPSSASPTATTTISDVAELSPRASEVFDEDHNKNIDAMWEHFGAAQPTKKQVDRQTFLGSDPESMSMLQDCLRQRIEGGNGETVYHLGFEDNASMRFTLDEWNTAYGRLVDAAKAVDASCELLCSKNVGGLLEIQGRPGDKDCHGKVLIRKIPQTNDENIETRIVVVGNGRHHPFDPFRCSLLAACCFVCC
jgi:hypothetical protein